MGSVNPWEAWLEYLLPTTKTKPPPKWMVKMAEQHAKLSAEVKALYDVDYYHAGNPESLLRQVTR